MLARYNTDHMPCNQYNHASLKQKYLKYKVILVKCLEDERNLLEYRSIRWRLSYPEYSLHKRCAEYSMPCYELIRDMPLADYPLAGLNGSVWIC
jgi:hypothetical protein